MAQGAEQTAATMIQQTPPEGQDDFSTTQRNGSPKGEKSVSSSYKKKSVFDLLTDPQNELHRFQYTPEAALHTPVVAYSSSASSSTKKVDDDMSLGNMTQRALPFPKPWYPVAGPSQLPPDFSFITESCGGKAAIGVFGGGVMGLLMGVFLGAMSDAAPPVTMINGREVPQAPLREQLKVTMRATAEKSMYWCRNFAFITGVFGGSECLVEKYRGTHDVWNSVISGCITGAALQAKAGPQAAAMGCGGFAAFSLAIDSIMGH